MSGGYGRLPDFPKISRLRLVLESAAWSFGLVLTGVVFWSVAMWQLPPPLPQWEPVARGVAFGCLIYFFGTFALIRALRP